MTRPPRFLSTFNSSSSLSTATADPPQAVAVESDFVVILAALLCALICVVGLMAVARCAWLRRSSAANNGRCSAPNKGLKKKILHSLPKITYDSAVNAEQIGGGECVICLVEYADGDEIRVLPQCGHGFHVACIDTWLGSHSSCPSCRQILAVARCRKCGEFPAIPGGRRTEAAGAGGGGGGSGSSSGFLPF